MNTLKKCDGTQIAEKQTLVRNYILTQIFGEWKEPATEQDIIDGFGFNESGLTDMRKNLDGYCKRYHRAMSAETADCDLNKIIDDAIKALSFAAEFHK